MTAVEARTIASTLAGRSVGTLIIYAELDEMLGRPVRDDRQPIYGAQLIMLREQRRTLINVPNKGYRISLASEHAGLATKQRRKARRSMTKAIKVIEGTDVATLTADERTRLDRLEMTVKSQANLLRRTSVRLEQHDVEIGRNTDRMDLLVSQLKARGIDVDA